MGECGPDLCPEGFFAFAVTDLIGDEAGSFHRRFGGRFVGVRFCHDEIPFSLSYSAATSATDGTTKKGVKAGAGRAPCQAKDGGSTRGNHLGSFQGPDATLQAIDQVEELVEGITKAESQDKQATLQLEDTRTCPAS